MQTASWQRSLLREPLRWGYTGEDRHQERETGALCHAQCWWNLGAAPATERGERPAESSSPRVPTTQAMRKVWKGKAAAKQKESQSNVLWRKAALSLIPRVTHGPPRSVFRAGSPQFAALITLCSDCFTCSSTLQTGSPIWTLILYLPLLAQS